MSGSYVSVKLAERLRVRHEWTVGKPASRVLAGAGHPGYGEMFSRRVLEELEAHPGLSVHQAVYGTPVAGGAL